MIFLSDRFFKGYIAGQPRETSLSLGVHNFIQMVVNLEFIYIYICLAKIVRY